MQASTQRNLTRWAYGVFALWMLFLALMAAFSAFGTGCNTCEAQIKRGYRTMWIVLASISAASFWLASRTPTLGKKLAVVASGAATSLVAVLILANLVMPK